MPIHPAQFSTRSRPVSKKFHFKVGKIPRLIIRLSLLVIFIFILVRSLQLGAAISTTLPNIPNENNYPISVNTSDRTNLLLARLSPSEPAYLALLSISSTGQAKLLPLPVTLYTYLARGYGFYTLAGAWKLGNLEGGEGLNLLRDSVSRMLAVPIDGYLAASDTWWEEVSPRYKEVASFSNYLSSWQLIFDLADPNFPGPKIYGSLNGWQIRSLAWMARSGGGVDELSLNGTTVTKEEEDGPVTQIDNGSFDSKIGRLFQETNISKEHARVSIVNSSGIPGAGSALSRYVKNLGGEVITVDSGQVQDKSEVRDHLGGSYLGRRIAPLIRASIVTDTKPGRADLEIIIGKDNKSWF